MDQKFNEEIPLEGDFIETYDHLIFDVKGFLHPKDRIIAFLRYVPLNLFLCRMEVFLEKCIESIPIEYNSQYVKWQSGLQKIKDNLKIIQLGNIDGLKKDIQQIFNFNIDDIRLRTDGLLYLKIYDMNARYDILTILEPSYIFCPENYDFPLQAVPISDIFKIHKPEEVMKEIQLDVKNNEDTKRYSPKILNLLKFVNYISEKTYTPMEFIGLSGSNMVGLAGLKADFDLIIYGLDNSIRVHNFLLNQFENPSHIPLIWNNLEVRTYTLEDLKKHYEFRAKGFDITFDNFIRTEKRKLHQFFVNDCEIFIRFLKPYRNLSFSEFPSVTSFDQVIYKNYGRIEAKGIVINDEESFLTPANYQIRLDSIINITLEDDYKQSNDFLLFLKQSNNIINIYTLRGRFTEQAKKDEIIYVRGKIEYIILHNNPQKIGTIHFYRIVLGIDSKDVFFLIDPEKI